MKRHLGRLALLAIFAWLLTKSCLGFQKIAWGTGNWWGEYSLKWGAGFFVLIAFCIMLLVLSGIAVWRREYLEGIFEKLIAMRENLGNVRWLFVVAIFVALIWFFQYTPWGLVFQDLYIRSLTWLIAVSILTFLMKRGKSIGGWAELLSAILLTSSAFVIAVPFMNVTDYPFSLGWSEGNRLWDYSVMFGRSLYNYPPGENIPVLLDAGRQLVGGLPFLIDGISIEIERSWIALTVILPYLILGLAVFRFDNRDWKVWVLAGLWVLLFLKQGPIHPPLVLIAAMVALAWRGSLWYAIPLTIGAGYFAQTGRFTWTYAPSIWILLLELASASFLDRKIARRIWARSITLGLSGLVGGILLSGLLNSFALANPPLSNVQAAPTPVAMAPTAAATTQPAVAITPTPIPTVVAEEGANPAYIDRIIRGVTTQPLLWYRLLPNATYGSGILTGLLIAALPLIILLIYLAAVKKWTLNSLQALVILGALSAFLIVGLIVSTKIGGGGDLHNLDMFLIGLMFTAVIAWQNGGREWLRQIDASPIWIKLILVLLFAIPGFQPLQAMRSYSFPEAVSWLRVLTDAPIKSTLEMLPAKKVSAAALDVIQAEVALARSQGGEVLFMDQRQLLTFGYITDVPLVPQYEKKMLMNEALSSNTPYFQPFYADLAAHRFALIISDPLRTPIKDSSYQFGEENNAWVTWVSNPVLCYYEEKDTLKQVNVQLLVPKREPVDCSAQLPGGILP